MDDHSTAGEPPERTGGSGVRPDRRKVILAGAAVTAGAATWTVPSIRSVAAAQAATASPGPFVDPARLGAWYDAALVTVDGGNNVLSWEDQSGNGNTASVPVPDPESGLEPSPTLAPTGINGLPAISFDGVDDVLVVPFSIAPGDYPNVTIFVVFQSNTDGFEMRKVYSNDAGFDRAAGLDTRAVTNYAYFSFAGPGDEVSPYFTLAADTPYLTADEWTATTFTGTVNGSVERDDDPVAVDSGAGATYLGALNELGGEPWDGYIAEVLIYVDALTPTELAQTQDYLLAKYGL